MEVPIYLVSDVKWFLPPFLKHKLVYFYHMRLYDSAGNSMWVDFFLN